MTIFRRSYYDATVEHFLATKDDLILGELTRNHPFSLDELQRNAWIDQITILKEQLVGLPNAYLAFEYAIPRMGSRVDVVILNCGIVFAVEFKVGETLHHKSALNQSLNYAVDLKNFHEQSHQRSIVPFLVATESDASDIGEARSYSDGVFHPIKSNKQSLRSQIGRVSTHIDEQNPVDPTEWINSIYKPTPTIIEAAQALYRGHDVTEISRSDSGAKNLQATSEKILDIIAKSKLNGRKSICFITGVPGAGKTLAGLNIANQLHNFDSGDHAVFLSGNGPLVKVLQEALARDEVAQAATRGEKVSKKIAHSKTKAFIQNIHHFRDDALQSDKSPAERVAIFDEAQRAWTKEKTRKFMSTKKNIKDFNESEPQFLISVLDRHEDWAVIVCLIGGGQEINVGEAGLPEWFSSIGENYTHWDVYVSERLTEDEYTHGSDLYTDLSEDQLLVQDDLHLSVSLRSFRAESLSAFVNAFLNDPPKAALLYAQLRERYPIFVTRDLKKAKAWLKENARGSEGIGLLASSGGHRLKPHGIAVKSSIEPEQWFLNPKSDIRSAGFLEDAATEFDIQGLELDWTCLAWDANLRKLHHDWHCMKFRGTEWQEVHKDVDKRYLINAYRVLMTRARQGMVIFIPEGDAADRTRLPEFYDPIYEYCIECGIEELN